MMRKMNKAIPTLMLLVLPAWLQAQQLNLEEYEVKAFAEMALEKVNTLSNYLEILCDKEERPEKKENTMMMALKLFINDRQTVETSSLNSDEVKYERIGVYLNRLRTLPYKQVTVKWYDVQYVSELKKGTDGRYYATITVFQEFTGFGPEGQILYRDHTQKNIDIVVETETTRIGDKEFESPMVKLGNIKVVQTK
jgi:hypothetical protein